MSFRPSEVSNVAVLEKLSATMCPSLKSRCVSLLYPGSSSKRGLLGDSPSPDILRMCRGKGRRPVVWQAAIGFSARQPKPPERLHILGPRLGPQRYHRFSSRTYAGDMLRLPRLLRSSRPSHARAFDKVEKCQSWIEPIEPGQSCRIAVEDKRQYLHARSVAVYGLPSHQFLWSPHSRAPPLNPKPTTSKRGAEGKLKS